MLNGAKTFTTNAHYADVCVAMAVTDRAAAQHGISAFIIEKGTPGFRAGKKENKLGLRASATGEVIFENCRLPPAQLLGKRDEGFVDSLQGAGRRPHFHRRALHRHGAGRLRRGAELFQAAQAVRPAHLRIPGHPAQAGGYGRRSDAARLLNYRAAWMLDHGQRVTRESAMAKLFASEAAVRIANEAVQIHGGYGFIKDYPVEKFYRDVKLCTIGEGTSEIQRLVIARQLAEKLMSDWAEDRGATARAHGPRGHWIENRDPQALATARMLARRATPAIVGITGPPGAGKSTLVDALARESAPPRQNRRRSSPSIPPAASPAAPFWATASACSSHHADPGVFIRSMATRGASGGLARATADLARLLDAAGNDYVLIETVGVGQDEIEIARLAQVTVVVLVPGMGDDVQAIKAGIMEIADVFVINKADQPGAERLERQLEDEHKPVVCTIATEAKGIEDLLDAIERQSGRPRRPARRARRARQSLPQFTNGANS